jgi:hypothetical protein
MKICQETKDLKFLKNIRFCSKLSNFFKDAKTSQIFLVHKGERNTHTHTHTHTHTLLAQVGEKEYNDPKLIGHNP